MQRMHYLLPGATSLIALTICAPAIADRDINYTYLEANVITRDIDVFDEGESFIDDFDDGSGWGVNGSFLFTDNFFLFGSYSRTESDVTYQSEQVFLIPSEEDVTRVNAGIGYKFDLANTTDFVARVAYTDIDFGDFEIGGGDVIDGGLRLGRLNDDESDGYFVDLGVRSELLDNLEGGIGIRYLDIEDIDDTSLLASVSWEISERWGISAELDAGDEVSTFLLGGRFRWAPEQP